MPGCPDAKVCGQVHKAWIGWPVWAWPCQVEDAAPPLTHVVRLDLHVRQHVGIYARNSSLNTCPVQHNSESSSFASRKMSTYFTGLLVPMSGKAWHMGRGKSSLSISTGVVYPTSYGFKR